MNESQIPHDDEIRRLLVEAGLPAELPADDLERIRRAARREWRGQSLSPIIEGRFDRGRRFNRTYLAIAATLVMVAGAVWLYTTGRSPLASTAVATVELVRGEDAAAVRLAAGDELAAGAELATDSASGSPLRLALRMTSGHSVRLDAHSRIRLTSATRLELERGAVYVDSGPEGAAHGLEIVTPLGTVREVGTQYEVRVDGVIRVRVREGNVTLSHGNQTFAAARGEQLTVDARGELDRSTVAVAGPDWSWVTDTAPRIEIEGRSIADYLDWVGRETGWKIRYQDPEIEALADEIVYGSIGDMTPEESLDVVLLSSGLGHRLEGDALLVTRAR